VNIRLHFSNSTTNHCDVGIYIDNELTGTLRLKQTEVVPFQMVIINGLHHTDAFVATGSAEPQGQRA
jgi:hypothetical protein